VQRISLVANVPAIPAVADYGLLNYPPIRKITRSRNPETCTAPAIARYSMCVPCMSMQRTLVVSCWKSSKIQIYFSGLQKCANSRGFTLL